MKKILFVSCVNDDFLYEEALFYINRLIVPDGYEVNYIAMRGVHSMTEGYNVAMKQNNAEIKIYMHQDVYILNPYFLLELINIFDSDISIGMVGMVGSVKLPADAMMWHGDRIGTLYALDKENIDYQNPQGQVARVFDVECIDGLLMATSCDMDWREDLFKGWDFYDISQSFEFRKAGKRVVVPDQVAPWVAHDDGIMNLYNGYNKYRNIFISNYLL